MSSLSLSLTITFLRGRRTSSKISSEMASTLRDLLTQERSHHGQLLPPEGPSPESNYHEPEKRCSPSRSSRAVVPDSVQQCRRSVSRDGVGKDEAPIDEVALRAVVSILGGYVGRYLRDEGFRGTIRDKCQSCLARGEIDEDDRIFQELGLGVKSIDELLQEKWSRAEVRMKMVRNSIRLLGIVASLNSKNSRNGSTCGVPNSRISACAQLYLSIVYKIERNDRVCARHLLQVFCDSPFLARTHLLPDLWEHFFLPHLLHLMVWYHQELEVLSGSEAGDKEEKMKVVSKVYNDQLDMGTAKFAMYYKDWLKIGVEAPFFPKVTLPLRSSYGSLRRRSLDSFTSQSSVNKNLYRSVFGGPPKRQSMVIDFLNEESRDTLALQQQGTECIAKDKYNRCNFVHHKKRTQRKSSSEFYRTPMPEVLPETTRSDYFQFFSCQRVPTVNGNDVTSHKFHTVDEFTYTRDSTFSKALKTICESGSLSDCEVAIRLVAKAWLESHNDPSLEAALTKAPVVEGILELLLASSNDDILELAISLLAELVVRNEVNRWIILHSNMQMEMFMRLLKKRCLFLKAAVLLYLLRPKAKQMISSEWVPLVLRVLEFQDQMQTLFRVRCTLKEAAFYLLEQLLTGFNEDKNHENARQVVNQGGLKMLVSIMEASDIQERSKALMIISCCIEADGDCRNCIADTLKMSSLLELLVLRNHAKSRSHAILMLTELLCLKRRKQVIRILTELLTGWGSINTFHVLLAQSQSGLPKERPLIAAIMLQLDLLADPLSCSIYREEAIEAIIESLDCETCGRRVQEQCARALLMLGGCFSKSGKSLIDSWMLQKAGYYDNYGGSSHSKEKSDEITTEEEETIQEWQNKAALALLTSSNNKRLLTAFSASIANGIPELSRACLITISWISAQFHLVRTKDFHSMLCSILVSQLIESSNNDKPVEERVLASFSLQQLRTCSGYACTAVLP